MQFYAFGVSGLVIDLVGLEDWQSLHGPHLFTLDLGEDAAA